MNTLTLFPILTVLTVVIDAVSVSGAEPVDTVFKCDSINKSLELNEIVVTATAHRGAGTSLSIGRNAMSHLQPTSFTDILELLPGNISKDPALDRVNVIAIRETGNRTPQGADTYNPDYSLTSLGTLFTVDGAPLMTDASMQGVGNARGDVRSSKNRGVDMRSLSTDDIEKVEIVRGIPSAEYGNFTSGVVHVTTIRRSRPLTARFKVDEFSKLAAVGSGWQLFGNTSALNIDVGWLDSKADPRNPRDNYRRVNASARLSGQYSGKVAAGWKIGLSYWQSFEKDLNDPDLSGIDEYRNMESSITFNGTFSLRLQNNAVFRIFDVAGMASMQCQKLERKLLVSPMRATIAPTSMQSGVSEGAYLNGEYVSDYRCDGRPINFFIKGKAQGSTSFGVLKLTYKSGFEWTYSKNIGRGQLYDLSHPLSTTWTARPRDFASIPGLHIVSCFVEGHLTGRVGPTVVDLLTGVRMQSVPSLSSCYVLSGRIIVDPRFNILWAIPVGQANISIGGGWGTTSRLPTLDYLYPAPVYHDFVQLNYYCVPVPSNSLVSLRTYIDDPTNYDLREAVNHKWEVRLGLHLKGFSLEMAYFRERLNDGFRYSTVFSPYSYRAYENPQSVPASRPDINSLQYTDKQVLDSRPLVTNGSRIAKQGVEVTMLTPRLPVLATRLSVSGAWFNTIYSSSETEWHTVTDVVGNTSIGDLYAGLYEDPDGQCNSQCSTTFMFDTQLSRFGLIVTTSLQTVWYSTTRRLYQSGIPVAYMDASGIVRPFGPEQMKDPLLSHLVLPYAADSFRTHHTPVAMYVNIKVTKTFGNWMRVALFVNRILDWLPEYKSNGLVIRRASSPYFGMEMSFTLNV